MGKARSGNDEPMMVQMPVEAPDSVVKRVARSAPRAGGQPVVVDARGVPPDAALPVVLELAGMRQQLVLRGSAELVGLVRMCGLDRLIRTQESAP